jgi:Domain of unknown function (DUF4175)
VRPPLIEPLYHLAGAWRTRTAASRRRIALAAVCLVWLAALLVARRGTPGARVAAALLLVASAAAAIGWRALERRRLRDPEGIVRGLVRGIDAARADRALRALPFVGSGEGAARIASDGTSPELARLHVARVMAELPSARVAERAARSAAIVGQVAIVGFVCAFGIVVAQAWSVLEGADVLAARRGVAPVTMRWLDQVDVSARPPEYLHEAERTGLGEMSLVLPYGARVTVRGAPLHAGRRLLLTDGAREVPFVEDGAGAVVARWDLAQTAALRVVARFGEVDVPQADPIVVESLPDLAPRVDLEGAPRQVVLSEQRDSDIPLRYEAVDDHGLREVHLVLRSGTREERRVLSRLDGETRSDRGGYVLKFRDPFVQRSHGLVEVTVEAKDNDPLTGPKWGSSPAIVLVPPSVGEPEARRLDALRRVRDALVDSLAWRLSTPVPHDAPGAAAGDARKALAADEEARAASDDAIVDETLAETYAGIRVPPRLRAIVVGQQQKTREAIDAEIRGMSPATRAAAVKATERFVLVVDAVVRGTGQRDARDAARELADVADDLALGASQVRTEGASPPVPARSPAAPAVAPVAPAVAGRSRGAQRMDASTAVLVGGGQGLTRLGALGRDLGEIVDADLARVKRARDAEDFTHAELAARDLATRLHEPDPSFGSSGGRMARAGGEAGGGRGSPGDEAMSPDEVERAFEESARDVEQLAQDHAGEMGKMERALAGATSDKELQDLRQEAARHAEAIRHAVSELPSVGMGSDSWTSKGAAARELAEQMAQSLEGAKTEDAVQSGRSAIGALDEAKKMLQGGGWVEDPGGHEQRRVDGVRRELDAQERWAEQATAEMRKRAAARARQQLDEGGDEEGKLADRARDIAERARERGSLPQQAVESIEDAERAARQAAEALKEGNAEKAIDRQREAQRALESASQRLRGDDDEQGDSPPQGGQDGAGARSSGGPTIVPGAGGRGPEDFRRRVLRGLGASANGGLKDAVRRYAEGLLR